MKFETGTRLSITCCSRPDEYCLVLIGGCPTRITKFFRSSIHQLCMKRLLIFLISWLSALMVAAQDDFNESKMVGFACFYEGRETKIVARFGKMLKRKKYKVISLALQSQNSAERYMAVVCRVGLNNIEKRPITNGEKILIDQIKTSTEIVAVCSGCMPHPGVELKQAFASQIPWGASDWIQKYLRN
jgi:hypothetical protein